MAVLLHTGSESVQCCEWQISLNTSSTEKCALMGIRTVVQMQAILSSRRSGGIEFIGVLRIFWRGNECFSFGFCCL